MGAGLAPAPYGGDRKGCLYICLRPNPYGGRNLCGDTAAEVLYSHCAKQGIVVKYQLSGPR